jgi:mannosyltransferase OCH1-like enzyme
MLNYFPEIKDAYDKLPLKVMKADLWRYCIIYKYGGIYHDADTVLKVNPNFLTNFNNQYLVMVPENDIHFCNWIFAAPPKSPVLKSIIDLSVERIRSCKNIKGEHIIHYLTGPGVFTDGIFAYLNLNKTSNLIQYGVGYKKINIGSSKNNSKTINIKNKIDYNKELTFIHNYPDTFSYTLNGEDLTITRTDQDSGWGQNLDIYQFNCISNIVIMPYNVFHKEWINHLFSGSWAGGWCEERNKYLR